MPDLLLSPDFMSRLDAVALKTRKIFTGRMRGERRSRRRGISIEFADYRDYSEGDDLRRVDWNIFGRLDRLFLKLFLEEEDLHLYIVVDTSDSMGFGSPRKIDAARRVAAAVGYIGLRGGERVCLAAAGDRIARYSRPLRGRRCLWQMFDFLAGLEPDGRTSLTAAAREFSLRFRRKGVVVLISDLLDPEGYQTAVKSLAGLRMDLCVIHLLAREEVEPDLRGDYKLIDIETQALVDVTSSGPLIKQYRRTVNAFIEEAREFCSSRGAAYAFLSAADPVEDFVLSGLREKGVIG